MRRATSSDSPPRTLLVGGRSVADDEAEAEDEPEDDYGFFAEQDGGEGDSS